MKILYYYPRREELSIEDLLKIKEDGSYIGGAEISSIKYMDALRKKGHIVDYNTPNEKSYDAIVFIWKPFDIKIDAKKRLIRPVNPYERSKKSIKELAEQLDGITCPSDFVVKEFSGLGINTFKHPLGVSKELIPKNKPKRDNLSFSYANVIHPRKGTDIILEAFYLALQENKNLKLHIYGNENLWGTKRENTPEFYEKVEEYLRKIPAKNLIQHDNIPHIQLLSELGKHRAHLVPSRIETGGSSILEAQAMGTPTIVLNKCSSPEYCGEGGLILPEKPEIWAEKIEHISSNNEQWDYLSQKAKQRIKNWTFDESTKILEEIIRK